MAYDPWGEVPAGWSVDFVVMPVRGMCRWSRRSIPLDALGEALAWSLYPAVVALAVLTESEVPAGPGFATNLGRLEVLLTRRRSPALQAGSSPKVGPWGTSGLQNNLVCPVIVAGSRF